jgi:uncharacterized cupredoxin-like copper-binding protein
LCGPRIAVTTNTVEVRMRIKRHFAALLVIGAAIAIPFAGCGGDDDDDGTSADTGAATQAATTGGGGGGQTVDMSAVDFKFDPSDPTVKSGDVTFNLTNDGQQPHSLEVEDVNGQDQEIEGDVSPGQSGTLTVNLKPGTYEFYCPVDGHKEMGMEGEITVN